MVANQIVFAKQKTNKIGEEMMHIIMEDKKFGDYSACYSDKIKVNKIKYIETICKDVIDKKAKDVDDDVDDVKLI